MTFTRIKQCLCSLTTRVTALENSGGGGDGAEKITSPDVSTFDDSRGAVGDWSYNESLNNGTYWRKVSVVPHAWIAMSAANE